MSTTTVPQLSASDRAWIRRRARSLGAFYQESHRFCRRDAVKAAAQDLQTWKAMSNKHNGPAVAASTLTQNYLGNRVWLHLLRCGGWWSVPELATDILGQTNTAAHQRILRVIGKLGRQDCITARIHEDKGMTEYAVFPDSVVPAGISVAEVQYV